MKVLASTPAAAPASTSALAEEPFKRVTRLAALALGTPRRPSRSAMSVPLREGPAPPETGGEWSTVERALCEYVIESGVRLVCDGALLDLRAGGGAARWAWTARPGGPGSRFAARTAG